MKCVYDKISESVFWELWEKHRGKSYSDWEDYDEPSYHFLSNYLESQEQFHLKLRRARQTR